MTIRAWRRASTSASMPWPRRCATAAERPSLGQAGPGLPVPGAPAACGGPPGACTQLASRPGPTARKARSMLQPADTQGIAARDAFKHAFLDNLLYTQGKFPALATQNDYYQALAHTVRDHLLHRWISTAAAYTRLGSRTVAYLSAEFLMGPHLGNNLVNLGMYDEVKAAITELGLDFDALLAMEAEPGLGNGGLGRLAACF